MSLRSVSAEILARATAPISGAPPAKATIRPATREELADTLAACSADALSVLVWGAGTHQGIGHRVRPDVVVSTERLDRIVDHQPDDLTLTVEAGVTVARIAALLTPFRQQAILTDKQSPTVGGVLATGASGYHRFRYGPSRDHVLEVTLVTGDGRVVRAGARVVKHVQGFDLMRLSVGSLGSLGVIVEACLKLWPQPPSTATVIVSDPVRALRVTYRPLAVVQDQLATTVMLAGTPEEVDAQAQALGGRRSDGLLFPRWDHRPNGDSGSWSIRVPPAHLTATVAQLPPGTRFVAEHGVGVITAALDGHHAARLRSHAENLGGSLVLLDGPVHLYTDPGPWGADPPALALQRRIVARFDPDRILNPGRPAGGI